MKQPLPIVIATSAALLTIWLVKDDPPSERSEKAAEPRPSRQAAAPPPATISRPSNDVRSVTVQREAGTRDEATVEEIQRALGADDPSVRNHAIERLLPSLAQRDPIAAARLVDALTDAELRAALLPVVANRWGKRNPQQAIDWAQTLLRADERAAVLTEVLSQVATSDPAEAVRLRQWYMSDLPVDPELENLAQRWAEKNFSAALQWSDALPPGEQRDLVVARAAFVQAQHSPIEAIQLVTDRMTEGPARTETLISVLHQWAQRDYAAASAWAEQLPPGALSDRAAQELAAVSNARQRE